MHRPSVAVGPCAVMLGLLVVLAVPQAAVGRSHVRGIEVVGAPTVSEDAERLARSAPRAKVAPSGADRCTGWRSTLTPPPTIRVLRSARPEVPDDVAGTVQEVPFADYVATVFAAEWPSSYPREALRAGAIAVKQYGWYYAIVYRGGEVTYKDGTTDCYDVVDTTVDQYYYPETQSPSARQVAAMLATWSISLRKYDPNPPSSRFFQIGYRTGGSPECGVDATGWKLFEHSVADCARQGYSYREILRRYLEPRLEIVEPGRHDIVGNDRGDASALERDGDAFTPRVWTPGSSVIGSARRLAVAAPRSIAVDDPGEVVSSDLDGDGHDDLLWLLRLGKSTGRLRVALGGPDGYGDPQTWFEGDFHGPLAGSQLLSADFNADGRRDAALLMAGPEAGTAQLRVLKKRSGASFGGTRRWWQGDLALDTAHAWAGDVSGDGRADLIVREDLPAGGVAISTALAVRPPPGLGPLVRHFSDTRLVARQTLAVAGDANRDGREDVLLVIGGDGRTRIDRLAGRTSGKFRRLTLWTAPASDPLRVSATKVGIADVDYDGRSDLVLYRRTGDGGTHIDILKARYADLDEGPTIDEPALPWKDLEPY